MWSKVYPEYLMGRIEDNTESYHRLDLICKNKKYENILKYDCGVYFNFTCKTSILNVKTKFHYNGSFRKIASELQVLGKLNGRWELLNKVTPFEKAKSEKCVVLHFDLFNNNYTEFQICLPAQGRIEEYMWIETDCIPQFKKLPLKAVLLGSSVSQDNNSSSHMNICCYTYRKYNINIATVGISTYHTLLCTELVNKLKHLDKSIKLILMDVHHIDNNILTTFKEEFKDRLVYFPVINSTCRDDVKEICNNDTSLEVIQIDGNGRYDEVHLNDYGTVIYLEKLKEKGIL